MLLLPLLSTFFFLLYHNKIIAIEHRIVITNVSTIADPDFGNMSITVVDSTLNYYLNIFHTIENAFMSNELFAKTSESGEFTSFFKIRANVCDFLLNPQKEPLMYLAYQVILKDKRNHMYTRCPIKPVKMNSMKSYCAYIELSVNFQDLYYVKDFYFDVTKFPFPVHNMKFILHTIFEVPNKNQSLHVRIEAAIQPKSNKRMGRRRTKKEY